MVSLSALWFIIPKDQTAWTPELQKVQLPSPATTGTVLFIYSKKSMLDQISVDNILIYLKSYSLCEFSCLLSMYHIFCTMFHSFFFFFSPAKIFNPKTLKNIDIILLLFSMITYSLQKSVFHMFVYALFCGKLFRLPKPRASLRGLTSTNAKLLCFCFRLTI